MSRSKQAFYENHSGSTISEINEITLSILLGHALYLTLAKKGFVKTRLDQFSWAFVCYVFNVLLSITVYASRHQRVCLLYVVAIFLVLAWDLLRSSGIRTTQKTRSVVGKTETGGTESKSKVAKRKIPFLSTYRATMMITTILSILAVDLPIFPRRYAKTETWGTSLMDLGVGSFVFSSGIVSATQNPSFLQGLRQGGLILAMGCSRALMVRGTNYHEHTSEYGVHWNFFITLSLLPPLLPVIRKIQRFRISFLLQGFLVCGLHQTLLVQTRWQSWIISAARTNIVTANKEGLSSFVGYVAIYLFGLDFGSLILSKRIRPVMIRLLISALTFLAIYRFCYGYLNIRVSRRIANAPYIMWVAAHNTAYLFLLALMDKVAEFISSRSLKPLDHGKQVARLVERINVRGLYVFLGANLLTGLINLTIGDAMMTTSTNEGLAIMLVYSLAICAATYYS